MAGEGSRFKKSGFDILKPRIKLFDKSLFFWSMRSFLKYFNEKFVFITLQEHDLKNFIIDECSQLNILNYEIYSLTQKTEGQAETVYKFTNDKKIENITIFNIDTLLINYSRPKWFSKVDAYMDCFISNSSKYSYAKIDKKGNVVDVAEKKVISNFASNGLYFFRNSDLFNSGYNKIIDENPGHYVAPIYSFLIKEHYKIKMNLSDNGDNIIIGTPEEYYNCLENIKFKNYAAKLNSLKNKKNR